MQYGLLLLVLVCWSAALGFTQNPLLSHDNKIYRTHHASNADGNGISSARGIGRKFMMGGTEYVQVPNRHSAQQSLDLNSLSLWERITFTWAYPLMQRGNNNSKPLELNDLWLLDDSLLMENSSEIFESYFINETMASTASKAKNDTISQESKNVLHQFWNSPVTRALVKMYKESFKNSGILKLFNTLVQFLPSILIAKILNIIAESAKLKALGASTIAMSGVYKQGVLYSSALFGVLCMKTIIENQYFYVVTNLGANIRGVLSSAIYRKSLRLSSTGRANNTVGEIVNFMQLDTNRMEYVASSIHIVWDGLLQVVGYTSLLLYFLGPAVLAGIAAMLVIIPVNAYFFKKLSKFRSENLKYTDNRVKLTSEILQGVRAIKAYNWEVPFIEKLNNIRAAELKSLKASANTRAILISVLSTAPAVVSAITLSVYALLGGSLTPTKVFTALALFNQLRFPLIFFPMLLNTLAEGKISLNRITTFLLANEVENYVTSRDTGDSTSISISSNSTFSWSAKSDDTKRGKLSNVGLNVKKGELVAVVGPVGSGKSTLLAAILGELHKENGSVNVVGDVAYVPQTAWIPNDSLRNVILYGLPYDREKYNQAIASCGLLKDIELMDDGDLTEIGERGVNLSGGQKQRVSIARAVYNDADIYLLDDPLSALDAEVGASLFNDCVNGVLKDKTRILVTHQLRVLPQVDRVIIMGVDEATGCCKVIDQGKLDYLLTRGYDLSKIVKTYEKEAVESVADVSVIAPVATSSADAACVTNTDNLLDSISANLTMPVAVSLAGNDVVVEKVTAHKKLMTVEERGEGAVGFELYKTYINAMNKPVLLALVMVSFAMANASQILQQYVIAAWTSDTNYTKRPLAAYLIGMTSMAALVAFFNWSRTCMQVYLGAAASETLHKNMIKQVLGAPLSYFESTPIGRLVQRFSKDLDSIDQQLPGSFGQSIASILNIIAAVVTISLVTPSFTAIMIPILTIYVTVTNYYRTVARELKRLDSISRSPIFSHFSETLGGLAVIRSFLRQKMFIRMNNLKIDDNYAAYFSLKVVDRWLSVRLELLGNIMVIFSALLAVFSGSRAGSAGISINNALSVTSLLNWAVRNGAETESLMNSVERVYYTTTQTPLERNMDASTLSGTAFQASTQSLQPIENDTTLLQDGWPWKGGITLQNVQLRYRDDFDLVLDKVNLVIEPGAKVGIVGRTGSGKSSLFRALLRLSELEGGSIHIDGVDISAVGLNALRSSIAIIPQDPYLFSGSIRLNLDPFNKHTDDELWSAISKSNLEPLVRSLPGGLAYDVLEGGDNFSIGQRQLFCLARALIRRSKILLLDEATSSVDYQTDKLIQKVIQEEFGEDSTVLTIAHRLDTIMDSDKVVLMADGKVVEVGNPKTLLKRSSSMFSKLVQAAEASDINV